MKRALWVLGIALSLPVGAMGCGIRNAVTMRHPLSTASVERNLATEKRAWAVQEHDLGVPWMTTASIIRMDEKELCFETKLRWIAEQGEHYGETNIDDPVFADVGRLVPTIKGKSELRKWRVTDAQPVTKSTTPGKKTDVRTAQTQVCDQRGSNCALMTTRTAQRVDANFSVYDGGGRLCVEHGGQLNKDTDSVILILAHPDHLRKETHRFAWKFQ